MENKSLIQIIDVGYDTTHYYLLVSASHRLLVDCGWPRTLSKLTAVLSRTGLRLDQIDYLVVTHYHSDHAGLVGEMVKNGTRLAALERQQPILQGYLKNMEPGKNFINILTQRLTLLTPSSSRSFLLSLGINGQIIYTPGHSDDSLTLILDSGEAFTGDLDLPQFATQENREEIYRSWNLIRGLRVKKIYPGHGSFKTIEEIFNKMEV